MSDSNLRCDAQAIAKEILANEICQDMAVFHKKQNRLACAGFISIAIGLGLLLAHYSPWIICTGIAGIVIGIGIFSCKRSGKRQFFKAKLIPLLLRAISPSLKYSPNEGLSKSQVANFKLFGSFDRCRSEDQITGKIGKTTVKISEIYLEQRHRDRDGNETCNAVFHGVVFIADFNKHFKCRTAVLPDTAEKLFGKLLGNFFQQMNFSESGKLVKLENVEFEKQFAVYSTDQLEARYILTPQLMERLLAVQSAESGRIRVLFENSNIVIAIPRSDNWLEPPEFGNLDDLGALTHTAQEIISMVKLVEDLDLNTRIWTKQ